MTRQEMMHWPDEYPKSELIADVEAMVQAITETLVSQLGEHLWGVWLKGSAARTWDTPIDYVPELSDVDIHYRMAAAEGDSKLADLESSILLHGEIEKRFSSARPAPLHTPRPQLMSVAHVEALPDYVPAPSRTVRTLYGASPSASTAEPEPVRQADARRLIEAGDPQFLAKQVTDLVERPGWHLYTALRHLNFRVSPLASRALSVVGVNPETAWSLTRTNAVGLLREKGQGDLAGHYAEYYQAGWECFQSRWRDGDAGRSAFSSAVLALQIGHELGRKFLALHADYRTSQSL